MVRVLLLLVLALVGAGGPVLAQSHFKDAVKGAVQGSTLDEVIAWSNARFARQAAIGRYVRWGGTILLGSALIARDWTISITICGVKPVLRWTSGSDGRAFLTRSGGVAGRRLMRCK